MLVQLAFEWQLSPPLAHSSTSVNMNGQMYVTEYALTHVCTCEYVLVHDQSVVETWQRKTTTPEDSSHFLEKNELPQAGLKPTTYCVYRADALPAEPLREPSMYMLLIIMCNVRGPQNGPQG